MARLGDYIEPIDERNNDLGIKLSQGICTGKYFVSPRQVSASAKSDKIVRKGYFAYNRATTRNGEKISIALREGEDCTVSSAYQVFRIKEGAPLLPKFLLVFFKRAEFDRYARYMSKGSAHEFFDYTDMCEVEIPLPSLEVQQRIVDVYSGLNGIAVRNERLLAPLKESCNALLAKIANEYESVPLGEYIEECNDRNADGRIKKVLGLSTEKTFREPNSRVDKSKINNYKIVHPQEFAYVPTTDTWKVFANAVNRLDEDIVVSPIYVVFKTLKGLNPDFLCLWFKRPEFDRYARYNSWGSARENFNYADLCKAQIPLPPIEVQESIAGLMKGMEALSAENKRATELLRDLCPALIQMARHSA